MPSLRLTKQFWTILLCCLFWAIIPSTAQDVTHTFHTLPFDQGILWDVHFVDAMFGWAVGDQQPADEAIIINTINGGDDWQIQKNDFVGAFQGVDFSDANTGYVVGQNFDNGNVTIFMTTDGGAEWVMQDGQGIFGMLEDVQIAPDGTVWVVGRDVINQQTLIMKSSDGENWAEVPHPYENGRLNAVSFVDDQNGWVVGINQITTTPIYLHTTDGGTTWATQAHGVTSGGFNQVQFVDPQTGWLAGNNNAIATLLKTIDGGTSWNEISIAPITSNQEKRLAKPGLFSDDMVDIEMTASYEFALSRKVGQSGFNATLALNWSIFENQTQKSGGPVNREKLHAADDWRVVAELPNLDLVASSVIKADNVTSVFAVGYQGETAFSPISARIDIPISTPVRRDPEKVMGFHLGQNYPNPFNPKTVIPFTVGKTGRVQIGIYDIRGREVMQLMDESKLAGHYTIKINGQGLSSGIYFYYIQMDDLKSVKKMVLLE